MSCGPERHGQRANLSTSIAGLTAEQPREFSVRPRHQMDRQVGRAVVRPGTCGCVSDSPTRNRGGPMLTWLVNPTRQPAASSPARVVTTYIG